MRSSRTLAHPRIRFQRRARDCHHSVHALMPVSFHCTTTDAREMCCREILIFSGRSAPFPRPRIDFPALESQSMSSRAASAASRGCTVRNRVAARVSWRSLASPATGDGKYVKLSAYRRSSRHTGERTLTPRPQRPFRPASAAERRATFLHIRSEPSIIVHIT